MKDVDVNFRPGVLDAIASHIDTAVFIEKVAEDVAKKARQNVRKNYPSTDRSSAIDTDFGIDATSAWADVGYTRSHPGFVLWWSEVGTSQMSARPHLRLALDQARS